MRPVYVLRDQQYMFDVLMVEKVLLMRKNLVAVLIVSTTDAMIAAVDSLIQAVRRVMG